MNKKLLKRRGEYYNFDKEPLFYCEFDEINGFNKNLQIDKKIPQKPGTILTGIISLNINPDTVLSQIENNHITLDQNDLKSIILISNDHKKTKIDTLLNDYEIYSLKDKEKEDYVYSLTGINKNYFNLKIVITSLDSNITQLKSKHDSIKNNISDLEKKLKKNNDDYKLEIHNCKQKLLKKVQKQLVILTDTLNFKDSLLKEAIENENKQPLCSLIDAIVLCNNNSLPKNYNGVWKCCKGDKTISYGYGKNGKKHGVQKTWWTNGQMKEKIFFENGKKHGSFEKFNESGEIRYVANYFEGVKDGIEKKWWDNGNLKEEFTYSNGKKDGVVKKFDKNGEIVYVVDYVEGIKDGMEKSWWDNGNLKVKFLYQNGKKDGFCYEWFENGNMKYEKSYSNGLLSGYYNVYHENGVVKKRALYSEGEIYGNPKCYDKNFNEIRCH